MNLIDQNWRKKQELYQTNGIIFYVLISYLFYSMTWQECLQNMLKTYLRYVERQFINNSTIYTNVVCNRSPMGPSNQKIVIYYNNYRSLLQTLIKTFLILNSSSSLRPHPHNYLLIWTTSLFPGFYWDEQLRF